MVGGSGNRERREYRSVTSRLLVQLRGTGGYIIKLHPFIFTSTHVQAEWWRSRPLEGTWCCFSTSFLKSRGANYRALGRA